MRCNKNGQQKFDEKLKKRFFNKYKFSKHDNNKFFYCSKKRFYTGKCMNDWEKLIETPLNEKEDFYSHLNMGYITDTDYLQAKAICKDLE